MNLDQLPDRLNLESGVFAILILLMAIALILYINRKKLQIRLREWRVQRSLNEIGHEQIRKLICPDGLDGHFEIDRLALTRDSIILINYKRYAGRIYCAERIAEWTQVVGQKSFKFENPLFELENQLASLQIQSGNVLITGYLYFNHDATFPKGHPPNILHPDNIPEQLLSINCSPVKPEIMLAWERLKAFSEERQASNQISVKLDISG
jgi:hypothetical protein